MTHILCVVTGCLFSSEYSENSDLNRLCAPQRICVYRFSTSSWSELYIPLKKKKNIDQSYTWPVARLHFDPTMVGFWVGCIQIHVFPSLGPASRQPYCDVLVIWNFLGGCVVVAIMMKRCLLCYLFVESLPRWVWLVYHWTWCFLFHPVGFLWVGLPLEGGLLDWGD